MQFPATLPPGVVRLDDEQPAGADDAISPQPFAAGGEIGAVLGRRRDRAVLRNDPHATRVISRPARRTGPALTTGSLDIDADLFTPASERLARQTPAGGIAARHTPSAGLSLAQLQAASTSEAASPSEAASTSEAASPPEAASTSGSTGTTPDPNGTTPDPTGTPATVTGAYPRRRDLRRQGSAGKVVRPSGAKSGGVTPSGAIPLPPQAPAGLAFVPAQSQPAPCSGGIPLGTPLPRRRDLRNGTAAAPTPTAEPAVDSEPTSTERTGAIAVGVARAAVMTMLVGVGYAVVSGHQLSLDVATEGSGATDAAAGAMLATGIPTVGEGEQPRVGNSDWDVRGEAAQVKAAGTMQAEVRVAAAKAAAARVQAAKRAAAARQAQLDRATREANRSPKAVAKLLAAQRGWGNTQFTCLDLLWNRESGWNYRATNPSSYAYGIPQALPGSKMASVAPDWRTNAVTQIKWGLGYISDRYGTPCGAWAHSQSTGWY